MINFITILLIQICLTLWGGLILYYKSKQSEQKFIQKIAELERNLELSKSDNGGTFYQEVTNEETNNVSEQY